MIRTILVPLTPEMFSDALLDAALSVAKRLNGHIRALLIQPYPDAAFAYLPDVILGAGVTREVIERETLEAAIAAKNRFADWQKRNDVPEAAGVRLDSCFASWSEHECRAPALKYCRVKATLPLDRARGGPGHQDQITDPPETDHDRFDIAEVPQTQTHLPRCLVAFENKSGEKAGRTMLDCQRIWQPQIVLWNNIRVDEGHDHLLSMESRYAQARQSQ